jgi:hypothetical protein
MADDPFDKWRSWQNSDKLAHPHSPAGGSGPGSSRATGFSTDSPSFSRIPHPDSPAGRQFDWQRDLSRIHVNESVTDAFREIDRAVSLNGLTRAAQILLGQRSFELGVCYGLAENGAGMVGSLLGLAKTFILAAFYDAAHMPVFAAGPQLAALHLQAKAIELLFGPVLKEAHAERDEIIRELLRAISDPAELLSGMAKNVADEYTARWKRLQELMAQPSLSANFEAGRIFGAVLFDVVMLISSVGGAVKAAKVLKDIPRLVRAAGNLKDAAAAAGKGAGGGSGGAAARAGNPPATSGTAKTPRSAGTTPEPGVAPGKASASPQNMPASSQGKPGPSAVSPVESNPSAAGSTSGTKRPTPTDRLKEHLTDRDLDAARREAKGEVVKRKADGTPWDHQHEVRDAQRGLLNRIDQINKRLSRPALTEAERQALTAELREASALLDKSEGYLPR